jgi:hypothetical protein
MEKTGVLFWTRSHVTDLEMSGFLDTISMEMGLPAMGPGRRHAKDVELSDVIELPTSRHSCRKDMVVIVSRCNMPSP